MLQSIQFVGSGPPTYIYVDKDERSAADFSSVLAAETRGYSRERNPETSYVGFDKKRRGDEAIGNEEIIAFEQRYQESLQNVYQKEYGKRDLFLWKQR